MTYRELMTIASEIVTREMTDREQIDFLKAKTELTELDRQCIIGLVDLMESLNNWQKAYTGTRAYRIAKEYNLI